MIRFLIILALACFATGARGEEPDLGTPYPFGSDCVSSKRQDDGTLKEPVCTPLAYAPIGSRFKPNFHENGYVVKWHKNKRADRAVPARPVSAEAAPK